MFKKILIMGLPGAGKTTLAAELAPLINAVVFNADAVRENINRDLGFSLADRIEHARRMSWMCDRVVAAGGTAIADFICPTKATREAFGPAFTIWVDRIKEGRYDDTNRMFEPPDDFHFRVEPEGTPRDCVELILSQLQPHFNSQKPTALFVGRCQPFHEGHRRLVEESIRRVGQCCIAVRDTYGSDNQNPLSFFDIKQRIDTWLQPFAGRYVVVSVPNISHVIYGRDLGCIVEQINLDEKIEPLSATQIRQDMKHS